MGLQRGIKDLKVSRYKNLKICPRSLTEKQLPSKEKTGGSIPSEDELIFIITKLTIVKSAKLK